MADTPILNYKGKYDGPEIDKAVELALGLENPESCPYYVHISLSKPDYVLTIGLGDAEGNLFNHAEIDLPLESMVVNATYENGNIILHLQDGTSTEPIPISALIAGLVSETRTVAGIDLKDDITPKELRDALDVYTKDSVNRLVSDLEDRINETLNEMEQSLNDLSDLTSEHDTRIKKNISDIAINRNSIGVQCKNLMPQEISSGYYGATDGRVTENTEYIRLIKYAKVKPNTKYTISSNLDLYIVWRFNGDTPLTMNYVAVGSTPYTLETPNNCDNLRISLRNPTEELSAFEWIQIEEGTVATEYEPYKLSVNERLVEVEESVLELIPQVEQNKSDIAINRTTLGTQCKNLAEITISSIAESNGVYGTVNGDKSITFHGVSNAARYIEIGIFTPDKTGKYILSGHPTEALGTSLYITDDSGFTIHNGASSSEAVFSVSALKEYKVKIQITANRNVENITFFPMVRYADITDPTYEPYFPSVNERLVSVKNDISINRITLGVQCINIFDGELKNGSINVETGMDVVNDTRIVSTNYIKVNTNSVISVSRTESDNDMAWRFYDKNKNYIGSASNPNYIQVISGSNTANILKAGLNFGCFKIINPEIAYIRFLDTTNSLTNKYMIVEGEYTENTMPVYEPYKSNLQERINGNQNDILNLRNDAFGTPAGRVTSNSDLNTFTTTGSYMCLSSLVAATLINSPISHSFRMEVKALAVGAERYIQIIYPNKYDNVYCYFRKLTVDGWTDWYKIEGVAVSIITPTAE